MVLYILGQRFELCFAQQFAQRALTVPAIREVCAVMFPQVFDLGRGMLVLDLTALLASSAIKPRILRGVTHH